MSSIWNGLLNLLGATLTFFYGLIPNFGVAIMLLTIAIGLVLFPLTLKQTRSMKAMQEIQPEIKRLQKEFKGDRAAQQQAMMALYRERGVNPAAGCLPMLLQMPIWFGLFSVLRSFAANSSNPLKYVTEGSALESAIEAGKSLNFLWMNLAISPSDALRGNENLEISGGIATALPYLITIAIVVASAYWQQKQTQARQQSGQAQPGQGLMKVFPFLFGFISFNLPAGLVVYFASSQLFRVGQQSLILGIDAKRAEAQPAKPRGGPPERNPKPESKSEPGSDRPSEARRRPPQQGSKKKRGKKRRRR
jgi:YidC/Oxa1 family membrane protein insertase